MIDYHTFHQIRQTDRKRYERGSTLITANQAYKNWLRILNNDSTMTSAVLDRVLHQTTF